MVGDVAPLPPWRQGCAFRNTDCMRWQLNGHFELQRKCLFFEIALTGSVSATFFLPRHRCLTSLFFLSVLEYGHFESPGKQIMLMKVKENAYCLKVVVWPCFDWQCFSNLFLASSTLYIPVYSFYLWYWNMDSLLSAGALMVFLCGKLSFVLLYFFFFILGN